MKLIIFHNQVQKQSLNYVVTMFCKKIISKEVNVKRSKIYKCCVISVLFILLSGLAHADEYSLNNVLDDFIGTYTPVQYDNILSSTRSHYDAMLSNNGQYHDILLLNENICYSNLNFHDGYAIRKNEFDNYNFVTNAKGKFIIDNNGNSYRKISDNIGSSGYADFTSYVLNIIFEDALAFNNVSLEGTKVIIDHIEYTTILDSVFFETDEVSLWMRGQGNTYALVLEGISAKLYKSEREQMTSSVSEDYMMEFPIIFLE